MSEFWKHPLATIRAYAIVHCLGNNTRSQKDSCPGKPAKGSQTVGALPQFLPPRDAGTSCGARSAQAHNENRKHTERYQCVAGNLATERAPEHDRAWSSSLHFANQRTWKTWSITNSKLCPGGWLSNLLILCLSRHVTTTRDKVYSNSGRDKPTCHWHPSWSTQVSKRLASQPESSRTAWVAATGPFTIIQGCLLVTRWRQLMHQTLLKPVNVFRKNARATVTQHWNSSIRYPHQGSSWTVTLITTTYFSTRTFFTDAGLLHINVWKQNVWKSYGVITLGIFA